MFEMMEMLFEKEAKLEAAIADKKASLDKIIYYNQHGERDSMEAIKERKFYDKCLQDVAVYERRINMFVNAHKFVMN